jgi:tetratricopeptide (TPR) repeat protein
VTTGTASTSHRHLLERYSHIREDHLRYMQKWGLIHPRSKGGGGSVYAFADLAVIRQADEMLADGLSFRVVLRKLSASRAGQLAFDFRLDARPAKVLQIRRRDVPLSGVQVDPREGTAEERFLAASQIDDGDPARLGDAAEGYRQALAADPCLVPAIINLANIHYSRDETAEAQALYERAIALEPDVFEAYFNLGNILHDRGRYPEAQSCYREALRLNPAYANAHFYLAVTLEKNGQSREARAHWRAYQQLAPQGEWFELAREFSE